MKLKISTLLTFSALTAATFFLTTSCKKSNSSSNAAISANVGSTNFQASTAVGTYSKAAGLFELVGITLTSGDTTGLALIFAAPAQVNAPASSDTAYIDVQYSDTKAAVAYDGGGAFGHVILNVSSWDSVNHKITGTVTGILYNVSGGSDSLALANGKFSTTYTVGP
jgi:hypothetical protein